LKDATLLMAELLAKGNDVIVTVIVSSVCLLKGQYKTNPGELISPSLYSDPCNLS
jgi:hypothetical protein